MTSGPAIERPGDIVSILTNLKEGDVLFIDEIHRLARPVEDVLYSAMEDYAVDVISARGRPPGRCASTQALHARRRDDATGAAHRPTPRPLRRDPPDGLLQRCRDNRNIRRSADPRPEMEVKAARKSPAAPAARPGSQTDCSSACGTSRRCVRRRGTLDVARVPSDARMDELGLDDTDRRILVSIVQKFDGGPVGIETLSAATSEEVETRSGRLRAVPDSTRFPARTPRGRIATRLAYEHLSIPYRGDPGTLGLWDLPPDEGL